MFPADIVGGLLLGIGIVLAGACPGTVFAQIGAGYKDAWVTLLGAITGALFYAKFKPFLQTLLGTSWPNEKLTLDGLLACPFWVIALIFIGFIVFILFLIEKRFSN
jgi:uncharacterized membrane protein YedE/YeeE